MNVKYSLYFLFGSEIQVKNSNLKDCQTFSTVKLKFFLGFPIQTKEFGLLLTFIIPEENWMKDYESFSEIQEYNLNNLVQSLLKFF